MIALDTNVIVRFLVGDDRAQGGRARAILEHEEVWIGTTVLLETEWVLRAAYRLPPAEVPRLLRALMGLPGVRTDDPARLAQALDDAEAGLDFADALHLAFAGASDSFATFDRDLARRAGKLGRVNVLKL